jgi:hypothetical protein
VVPVNSTTLYDLPRSLLVVSTTPGHPAGARAPIQGFSSVLADPNSSSLDVVAAWATLQQSEAADRMLGAEMLATEGRQVLLIVGGAAANVAGGGPLDQCCSSRAGAMPARTGAASRVSIGSMPGLIDRRGRCCAGSTARSARSARFDRSRDRCPGRWAIVTRAGPEPRFEGGF